MRWKEIKLWRGKKIKLCINSNIADAEFIERLIKNFKTITVKELIPGNLSAEDKEIITRANGKDYHIITKDTRDFKRLFLHSPNLKIGVIGINTDYIEICPKLEWLLDKKIVFHKGLYNRFYEIDSEGYKCCDKAGNEVIPKTPWSQQD
ncbi:MAG: DUF5615 family PIN-like protein [Candidatus Nealsonbacteria bacterium]